MKNQQTHSHGLRSGPEKSSDLHFQQGFKRGTQDEEQENI